MDEHQSDDQQVEALKTWWQENGRSTITGIILGIAAVAGWQGWQSYKLEQASEASSAFQFVLSQIDADQVEEARSTADLLMQEHPDNVYASLTALMLGRTLMEQKQTEAAQEYLGWVETNGITPEFRQLATLRRARVMLDAGELDAALGLLQSSDAGPFQGLYADLKGDIQLAKGMQEEARQSYVVAMATVSQPALRQLLEMKVDDLGGPAVEMATP